MATIKHKDSKFNGSILGVAFKNGTAETDKPRHVSLMRRLGHTVVEESAPAAKSEAPKGQDK